MRTPLGGRRLPRSLVSLRLGIPYRSARLFASCSYCERGIWPGQLVRQVAGAGRLHSDCARLRSLLRDGSLYLITGNTPVNAARGTAGTMPLGANPSGHDSLGADWQGTARASVLSVPRAG